MKKALQPFRNNIIQEVLQLIEQLQKTKQKSLQHVVQFHLIVKEQKKKEQKKWL